MMITKTKKVILILMIVLIALVSCVTATTYLGTLGSSATSVFSSYTFTNDGTAGAGQFKYLTILGIEHVAGLSTIVKFDNAISNYDGGAPPGVANVPFTAHIDNIGGAVIGLGTIGYQRLYDGGGTEQLGYQYLIFNNWTGNTYAGNRVVYIDYNTTLMYHWAISTNNCGQVTTSKRVGLGIQATYLVWVGAGDMIVSTSDPVLNDYTITAPLGIGAIGNVSKLSGGTVYPSKAWIFNATGYPLTSETTVTSDDFIFNVPIGTGIKIGIQSPNFGTWYNTSVFFAGGTGTPTPTVTPTPVPTIPYGYVRTTVLVWDINGNRINEANIDIYDIEGAVWSNSTSDADGMHYIDTLPYHTLNIYGSYDVISNVYVDTELLGMETGYYGNYYYLTMLPYVASPPGAGNTNLYIQVRENITKLPVSNVFLQVSFAGNATLGVYTNSAGLEVVTVPNNTVMQITATKPGWMGNVITINSGPGPSSVVSIGIDLAYVSPTPTLTAGPGGTIPTTYLPGIGPTSSAGEISKAQDNEMMNKIRTAGPYLIDLAILATVMGLLYLIMGKKL
jgi:hypothetical protein